MRIAYWGHWIKPNYTIQMFLRDKLGIEVTTVDYKKRGYLDDVDGLIIGQNSVNDCIENDRDYIHEFVARGGVCWITHQDCERCNPCFLPEELGRPLLVERYYPTLPSPLYGNAYAYLMPWMEREKTAVFDIPNKILPEDLIYWEVPAKSFGLAFKKDRAEIARTTSISAITDTEKWDVVGSYIDPAIPDDGALVMQAKYGKGLFFWSQILFPEESDGPDQKPYVFWRKFAENVLAEFARFRKGIKVALPVSPKPAFTGSGWLKTIIHLHSLDWYAADNSLCDINAAMRALDFEVAVTGYKDAISYHDTPDHEKYSDDKVKIIPGMEYHPFNFERADSTNAYHILAMGVRSPYNKFTRALFDKTDVDSYVRAALAHIRNEGGVSCATHPNDDYWRGYDFDATDTYQFDYALRKQQEIKEGCGLPVETRTINGSMYEKAWMDGSHITLMSSVDMWGVTRLKTNPIVNFIHYDGAASRETLLDAVRKGHVMCGYGIDRADIRLGAFLPGDTVGDIKDKLSVEVSSATADITRVEVFFDDILVRKEDLPAGTRRVSKTYDIDMTSCKHFVRVEITGAPAKLCANPFFRE